MTEAKVYREKIGRDSMSRKNNNEFRVDDVFMKYNIRFIKRILLQRVPDY